MAPFKLKFRMGSSRSTSQEVDTSDLQANQSLLNNSNLTEIGASCSTIDSADCTSIGSIGNDRRSLLPNNGNNVRLGYLNPILSQSEDNTEANNSLQSYEQVLEENVSENYEGDNLILALDSENCSNECNVIDIERNNSQNQLTPEQMSVTCTDPDCKENFNSERESENTNHNESIDSTEYLISTMTTPSSHENLIECTGSCDPLYTSSSHEQIACDDERRQFQFPSASDMNVRNEQKQHHHQKHQQHQQQQQQQQQQHHHHHHQQQQQHTPSRNQIQNSQQFHSGGGDDDENDYEDDNEWNSNHNQITGGCQQGITTSEIISNKSSKEIYKAVAKQWGITCKMSDQCRCMECQGHYFDCEFDDNDHQKTDGGLGAGTPMFISEVMHGSACTIL